MRRLWLHILRVQGKDFKHVVVGRTIGRSTGTSIDLTRGADLITAVRELRALRLAFGQTARRPRNIPHEPMDLIVSGSITGELHVVHMEHEALRPRGRIGPCQRGRCAFTWRCSLRGLTELDGDWAAIGKCRRGQRHRRSAAARAWSWGASTLGPGSFLSTHGQGSDGHDQERKT